MHPVPNFHFRPAAAADLDAMAQIAAEAKAFLRRQGVDQWQRGPYPDRACFAADIRAGLGHVLARGDAVAAVCALSLGPDPTYRRPLDGRWLTSDETLYAVLHRVAVSRDFRARGLAAVLFDAAAALAADRGAQSLRIDTHPDNRPMQAALARSGFARCTTLRLADGAEAGELRLGYERLIASPPDSERSPHATHLL
jgi:GNAT superfamily N-acetyltransferase